MILDSLENCEKYFHLHPNFAEAFRFLKDNKGGNLEEGEHTINGTNVFAIVSEGKGKGKDKAKLEVHKKYIDIQYVAKNLDFMGWKPASECSFDADGFAGEKDCGFFTDDIEAWFPVNVGRFAIFFPEDAHAPMGTDNSVRKIIIKVAV